MLDIPTNSGWILFADCDVTYSGRASSFLHRGNYLIVYKPDQSLSIHGASLVQPRNYLSGGTRIIQKDNIITFHCKKEQIQVTIHGSTILTPLVDWSDHKIIICKTEKELALKIFHNWDDYFSDTDVEMIHHEFQTPLGPIDVLGQSADIDYIIEVKRRTATIKDVTQLRRYAEAIETPTRSIIGFLAAPAISKKALDYLHKHDLRFLKIEFDS